MAWEETPFAAIVVALWVIVMARANATYWIGRGIAEGTARTRWASVLRTKTYIKAERWIDSWGALAVTVSFLTVGFQTVVNMSAGITRMPLRKYLPSVVLGCLVWAVVYGSIGFIGYHALVLLWKKSPWCVIAIGLLLLVAGGVYIASVFRRRNQAAKEVLHG